MSQVITTILLSNNATGIKLAELHNWKANILVVPRAQLSKVKEKEEINQPGIYFLFGDGSEKPVVYIGQSENCFNRLADHNRQRSEEEWNTALVFTGGLHSTYVKYLESIAVKEATNVGRYEVVNGNSPSENQITEAQRITASEFFDKIQVVASFFGYQLFESAQSLTSDKTIYYLTSEHASANAQLLDDGTMNVLKGSLARLRETQSFGGWAKAARIKYLGEGVIVATPDNNSYEFTQDVIFSSPSAAAATIAGRSINGWTAWKDADGNTLDSKVRNKNV
jgi:hypothetical protein